MNQWIQKAGCLLLLPVLCLSTVCSHGEKVKNAQTFFTAFNHLLEADTLHLQGSWSAQSASQTFDFYLDQQNQLECALFLGSPADNSQVDFFIRDGKTYLDYQGTTSQSLAENIGIQKDTRLDVYNPFLDLNDQQRADLFDSITVDEDTYTFQINPGSLSTLLDSYGTAQVRQAVMTAVIEKDELRSLDLQIEGTIAAAGKSDALHIRLQVKTDSINEPVQIPWPDNLSSYGQNS